MISDNYNVKFNFFYMARTSTRVRDARTGQFVPDKEATRRPATTVKETIKVGPTKKQSK
jgi:hypothetical protein